MDPPSLKLVRFNSVVECQLTFSKEDYDRSDAGVVFMHADKMQAFRELNEYKRTEMFIHPDAEGQIHWHFCGRKLI